VTGLAHSWFGGPGEPVPGKQASMTPALSLRHPVHRIVGFCAKNTSVVGRLWDREAACGSVNQPPRPGSNRAEKDAMNRNSVLKSLVLALAVLLATSAFASNKGSLNLQDAVQVNGQQLAAGSYQLRWEGSGSNVELSFLQGKKVVAKTAAKMVDLDHPAAYDAAVVDTSSRTISQLRFAGKKYALDISGGEKAEAAEGSGMK
jgi:hypothetical protein